MNKRISRQLDNCFDAYTYYPFKSRYESFKEKKSYFLSGLTDEEKYSQYQEFIFFHFCYWHLVYPKHISKKELLQYFYYRKR